MEAVNKLKVFISYSSRSTRDKVTASEIKSRLEAHGLDVFLAHRDICSGDIWQKTMLIALDSCDIFMPIMTKSIRKSEWANQEMGFAYALREKKRFIPIKDGQNPQCMIGKYEALECSYEKGTNKIDYDKTVSIIIKDLIKGKNGQRYASVLKKMWTIDLSKSKWFTDTRPIYDLLRVFDKFTQDEIVAILKVARENPQVGPYGGSPRFFKEILEKSEPPIPSQTKKQIIKEIESMIHP